MNIGFGSTALTFCFKFGHMLGLFCTFLGPLGLVFGPLGLFLESGSGSELEPTYVVNQLWFWSTALSFCFYFLPNFGPFLHFLDPSQPFLGSVSGQKLFCRQSTLVLEYSPIFLFLFGDIWTSLALFRALWALI